MFDRRVIRFELSPYYPRVLCSSEHQSILNKSFLEETLTVWTMSAPQLPHLQITSQSPAPHILPKRGWKTSHYEMLCCLEGWNRNNWSNLNHFPHCCWTDSCWWGAELLMRRGKRRGSRASGWRNYPTWGRRDRSLSLLLFKQRKRTLKGIARRESTGVFYLEEFPVIYRLVH